MVAPLSFVEDHASSGTDMAMYHKRSRIYIGIINECMHTKGVCVSAGLKLYGRLPPVYTLAYMATSIEGLNHSRSLGDMIRVLNRGYPR